MKETTRRSDRMRKRYSNSFSTGEGGEASAPSAAPQNG